MVPVAETIAEVQKSLLDTNGVHYTLPDLASYMHQGELVIGHLRPDELVIEEDLQLVAGTRQNLPANATRLIDVLRNRGRTGAIAEGPGIRLVERGSLDDMGTGINTGLDWRTSDSSGAQQTEVWEYNYDGRYPDRFDVFPPMSDGDTWVSVTYEAVPPTYPITAGALDDPLQVTLVGMKYKPALIEWCMYRALSREDDLTEASVNGSANYQRFFELLGATISSDSEASLKKRFQLR